MDIRIINKENNMFAVGSRTLRTNGQTLCLYDANSNKLETIEVCGDNQIAENIKTNIIDTIEVAVEHRQDNITICL